MLTTKKWVAAAIFTLVFSAATALANPAQGNPNSETPLVLAMPEETINYTITRVNGVLWAKIDGTYPLYFLDESKEVASCVPTELPMLYPTPPNTTNIHLRVNETEIGWNHWDYDTHHTAIGEWQMIYCVINPVTPYFQLTIHYEHPIEAVNGSNLFLYDLNISDYLTEYSNTSIAHFTVHFETEVSDVRAYTTFTDSEWNPKYLTINSDGEETTVNIEMTSVLDEPLAGDLVIMFNDPSDQLPEEFPYWLVAVPIFLVAGLVAAVVYRRTRR